MMNVQKKAPKRANKTSLKDDKFLVFLEKLSDKFLTVDVLHSHTQTPDRFRFKLFKENLTLCSVARFFCEPCSISFHPQSFEIAERMVFFIYVMAGSCTVGTGEGAAPSRRITADQFMFADAMQPLVIRSEGNLEIAIISVSEAYVQTHTAYRALVFPVNVSVPEMLPAHCSQKSFLETLRSLPKIPKRFHEVLIDGVFFFLRPVLNDAESFKELQAQNRTDYLRFKAERILLRRFREPRLEMSDVADDLGISVRYLSAVFRKNGTTFSEELMRLRLNKASVMLREEHCMNLSVSDIARITGFTCLSHFSRAFKSYFGKTPTEMRGSEIILASPSVLDK